VAGLDFSELLRRYREGSDRRNLRKERPSQEVGSWLRTRLIKFAAIAVVVS